MAKYLIMKTHLEAIDPSRIEKIDGQYFISALHLATIGIRYPRVGDTLRVIHDVTDPDNDEYYELGGIIDGGWWLLSWEDILDRSFKEIP